MNRSILVTSVVVAIAGAVAVAMSVAGDRASGTFKNDIKASVSSLSPIAAVAAGLSGAPGAMHALEAAPVLVAGDSRLDNYRLERDSCCIGND